MQGFKYNGIHSSDLGVYYIPDASARGDFFADYEIVDMDRAGRDGGEYYYTRVKTRVRNLDCYYEQITFETREKILRWLDRRTSGELIFDERSYATYHVRPTKKIEFKDYLQTDMGEELYSGTFTITFSAYDPFAELNVGSLTELIGSNQHDKAAAETGLIDDIYLPRPVGVSDTDFYIYNPGTEIGHSIIRFAGSTGSSDFIIYNATTKDKFVLKAGLSTKENEYYEINSKTGRVERVNGSIREIDFAFHDEGYITFAPCEVVDRSAFVKTTLGSRTVTSDSFFGGKTLFNSRMKGKYISDGMELMLINEVVSSEEMTVNADSKFGGTMICTIADMNYLTIQKAADANITRLEVICKAEVR